jgi:HD superfamily phosphohydrolase
MSSKYLRDPVHGSIGFENTREKLVLDLINTREFQRLRRIRQLGALFLTFHGAEHTRFTHSVGVAWMAKRIFDSLDAQGQLARRSPARERTRLVAIVAALLHDLGHGPFSHLYEKVFDDRRHEEWTARIIRDPGSEAGRILRRAGMTDEILAVYDRRYKPAFVSDLVSSQLDADRLDYLLRDSLMTGVAYGQYDLEWILINLRLARRGRDGDLRLCLNAAKGYHAAEQFVIARYLMYQQVYYHKTARAAEQMIRMALQRLVDAHRATGRFPDPCPQPIRRLIETRGDLTWKSICASTTGSSCRRSRRVAALPGDASTRCSATQRRISRCRRRSRRCASPATRGIARTPRRSRRCRGSCANRGSTRSITCSRTTPPTCRIATSPTTIGSDGRRRTSAWRATA